MFIWSGRMHTFPALTWGTWYWTLTIFLLYYCQAVHKIFLSGPVSPQLPGSQGSRPACHVGSPGGGSGEGPREKKAQKVQPQRPSILQAHFPDWKSKAPNRTWIHLGPLSKWQGDVQGSLCRWHQSPQRTLGALGP